MAKASGEAVIKELAIVLCKEMEEVCSACEGGECVAWDQFLKEATATLQHLYSRGLLKGVHVVPG
jgi:hypothetical protein